MLLVAVLKGILIFIPIYDRTQNFLAMVNGHARSWLTILTWLQRILTWFALRLFSFLNGLCWAICGLWRYLAAIVVRLLNGSLLLLRNSMIKQLNSGSRLSIQIFLRCHFLVWLSLNEIFSHLGEINLVGLYFIWTWSHAFGWCVDWRCINYIQYSWRQFRASFTCLRHSWSAV